MAKKVAARTLDFSNVKESSGISKKYKEDGEYLAKITEVRDDPAKDGEAMWMFIVQLSDDRTATYPYYCKLVENQLWKLRNLFIAAGVDLPKRAVKIDPNKVVGKSIGVILDGTEYEGKQQSEIGGVIPPEEIADFVATEADDDVDEDDDEEEEVVAPKRRGRPKKVVEPEEDDDDEDDEPEPAPKKRGRPKKVVEPEPEEDDDDDEEDDEPEPPKRKRGRPAKAAAKPVAKKRRRSDDDDDDDLELDL